MKKEDLINNLNNNYKERRDELSNIKALIDIQSEEKYLYTLIKTWILLIYSHFQWFIEYSIYEYENFLKEERINIDDFEKKYKEIILSQEDLLLIVNKYFLINKKLPIFWKNYFLFRKNNNWNILFNGSKKSSNSIDIWMFKKILNVLKINNDLIFNSKLIKDTDILLIYNKNLWNKNINSDSIKKWLYDYIFDNILKKYRHLIAHWKSKWLNLNKLSHKDKYNLYNLWVVKDMNNLSFEKIYFDIILTIVYDFMLNNFKEEFINLIDKEEYLIEDKRKI